MRKLLATLLISVVLLLTLAFFTCGSISAQAPDSPPAKGPEPAPAAPSTEPTPPPLQIEPALLPKIEPQLLKKLIEPGVGVVECGELEPHRAFIRETLHHGVMHIIRL